jgi:hypothetical protein
MLDAPASGMSENRDVVQADLSADFTHFLSARLGTDASSALSQLGTFLLDFEPSWRRDGTTKAAGHRFSNPPISQNA